MSSPAQPFLTVEQYLAIERAAETRSEYYNGRMYAMAGGTFRHALINGNLAIELGAAARSRKCFLLPTDMRTIVAGLHTYPDIVLVCGQPQFAYGKQDTLLNPTLVIETLSPSTEGYDRGFESAHFRKTESLREYAIVSQIEPRVEIFRRQADGDWLLSEYVGIEAACRFETLDCLISLAGIYDRVEFDAEEQARAAIPPTE